MKLLKNIALAAAILVGAALPAAAQSACQYIVYGAVLTAAQWNSCFQAKADLSTVQALTPGGANGSVQFNNNNALGGAGGVASNGTGLLFQPNAAIFLGSSSGQALINAPATGGGILTLPPGTDTIAGIAATQTLTNKSMSGSANTFTNLPATGLTGVVPVVNGGTGLSSGTINDVLFFSASGTIGHEPLAVVYVNNYASAMSSGTPDDCVHDATPAVLAAKAALAGTGGQLVFLPTGGCYKMNLTVGAGWDGIALMGPSAGKVGGAPPSSNYIAPYDTTKPAITISDTTANVFGWSIRNMVVLGGEYGIKFQDGANNGNLYDVSVESCTITCVWYDSDYVNSLAITYINWFGGTISPAAGSSADDLVLEGDGSGYANALNFYGVNFQGNGLGGHTIKGIGATQATFHGGYSQSDGPANGLLVEGSQTNSSFPQFAFDSMPFDNGSGSDVTVENLGGDPLNSRSPVSLKFAGYYPVGPTLHSDDVTTGSITASSASLTVASATGITQGMTAIVYGAGASGVPLQTTVSSVSGTTVTLAANASTTVSGAAVEIGNISTVPSSWLANSQAAGSFQVLGNSAMSGYSPYSTNERAGMLGITETGNSYGFPFSANYFLFNADDNIFGIGMKNGNLPTVSSLTRTGTTVTVTFTASPGPVRANASQISIAGEQVAQGINGTWTITSWNSGTNAITFTSPVSGTVSAATGTIAAQIWFTPYFNLGNLYLPNELYMADENGNMTDVLFNSQTNSNFFVNTPDVINGTFNIGAGTAATTACRLAVNGGGILDFCANGYGAIGYGNISMNASSPLIYMGAGSSTVASQTPASGTLYFTQNSGQLLTKDSAGNIAQVQMSDGHNIFNQKSGSTTSASSNGTSATCTDACNDNEGRFTLGASPNTIFVLTFASSWPHAPACYANDETAGEALIPTTVDTGSVSFTGASSMSASDKVSYGCRGSQ